MAPNGTTFFVLKDDEDFERVSTTRGINALGRLVTAQTKKAADELEVKYQSAYEKRRAAVGNKIPSYSDFCVHGLNSEEGELFCPTIIKEAVNPSPKP